MFSPESRRDENMKIEVFFSMTGLELTLVIGFLDAFLPPKSGARHHDYELLQSFKPNCALLLVGILPAKRRSACAAKTLLPRARLTSG